MVFHCAQIGPIRHIVHPSSRYHVSVRNIAFFHMRTSEFSENRNRSFPPFARTVGHIIPTLSVTISESGLRLLTFRENRWLLLATIRSMDYRLESSSPLTERAFGNNAVTKFPS
jgi:hypothetical protein